jgi:hypothetical protein
MVDKLQFIGGMRGMRASGGELFCKKVRQKTPIRIVDKIAILQ